jgi:alpha-L-fucosidase
VVGKWLQQYGESVYGTRGGPLTPQPWGITTQKDKKIYIHLFAAPDNQTISWATGKAKVKKVSLLGSGTAVPFKQQKETITVSTGAVALQGPDTVIVVELK